MQYYNVHSHIFTMNNAPRRFLHLYLPEFAANAVDKITNTQAGAEVIAWILAHIGGNGGKRYASFLKIGKSKNQAEVFEDLIQQYDDESMKFVALTMYMEKCGAGASETGFEGQLEEILTVKKRYPDRLLIFVGIDPRWKNNGTELRKTVEAYFEKKLPINATRSVYPFVGLKLYPSMGFYTFDEKLKETFEWAADNGVPVLTHCNYLGGIYHNDVNYVKGNLNPLDPYTGKYYSDAVYLQKKNFKKWLLGTNSANNNLNSCSYFLEPASYETLLDYFHKRPGDPLKLCLAHYGGGNQIVASDPANHPSDEEKNPYGIKKMNWFFQVRDMLQRYRGLYTDISYALHDPKVHAVILDELNNPVYGERILYGTDFYLTEREQEEKFTYGNFKKKAIEKPLTNFGNIRAWDMVAGKNVEQFLQSKYYTGKVI